MKKRKYKSIPIFLHHTLRNDSVCCTIFYRISWWFGPYLCRTVQFYGWKYRISFLSFIDY